MNEIIEWIIAPLVVVVFTGVGSVLWHLNAKVNKNSGRDEERWVSQEHKWEQNEKDHERAFSQLEKLHEGQAELKTGVAHIEGKLDTLLERNGG